MIYSRSTEYAIRALIPLSQVPDGKYTMVKTIAEQEDIPSHFLAKILQQLARKGLLRSSKGPMGGFCLRVPASDIRLLDVVEALDGIQIQHLCIGGYSDCGSKRGHCALHDGWTALPGEYPGFPARQHHCRSRQGPRAQAQEHCPQTSPQDRQTVTPARACSGPHRNRL